MANQRAWNDRQKLMQIFKRIEDELERIQVNFNKGKDLVADIKADNDRKSNLVSLLKEDEVLSITSVQDKISYYKTLHDWLLAQGYIQEIVEEEEPI